MSAKPDQQMIEIAKVLEIARQIVGDGSELYNVLIQRLREHFPAEMKEVEKSDRRV